MSSGAAIDHRRRDSKKRAFWRRMIRDQARAGLSVRAWCRKQDLSEPAFYWWRRRIARVGTDPATPAPSAEFTFERSEGRQGPAFVAVQLAAENDAAPIEIVLPGDQRVRLRGRVDRQMLVDVLAALNRCVNPSDDRAGSRAESRPC